MSKHTAGQWYTGNSVFGDLGVFTDADVHPNMICSVKKSVEDARLIAAAPEMLDALIYMVKLGYTCDAMTNAIESATGHSVEEVVK